MLPLTLGDLRASEFGQDSYRATLPDTEPGYEWSRSQIGERRSPSRA